MVLEHIKKLLFEHDCVIMPDFGGLITHYEPAKIHPVRHTVSPPAKRVAFNEKLKLNDGLLISTLAYDNELSADEAQQQVTQFVQELQRELNHNRRFDLKGIGIFRLNEESKVVFEYIENENFLSDSFGLPELLSKPVIATEPVLLRTLLKDQNVPAKAGFRHKIRRYYRAATALVIGGVVVSGLYLLSLQTDYNVSAINPITLFQSDSAKDISQDDLDLKNFSVANENLTVEVQPIHALNSDEINKAVADSSILITSADFNDEITTTEATEPGGSEINKSEATKNTTAKKVFGISNPKKLTIAPGEAVLISAKSSPTKAKPVTPAPKSKSVTPALSDPSTVKVQPSAGSAEKEIKRNFTVDEINAALSASGQKLNPESTGTGKSYVSSNSNSGKEVSSANKITTRTNTAVENSGSISLSTIKPKTERFYVIVNGYSTYESAERNRKIIAKKGRPGQIIAPYGGAKLYRIAIAEYNSRDQAIQNLPELKNKYGNTIWILKR